MLSWSFAAAAGLLVVATRVTPPPWRAGVAALVSLLGLAAVWAVPVAPLLAGALAVFACGRLLPALPPRLRPWALAAAVIAVVASQRLGPRLAGAPLLGLSYLVLKLIQHLIDAAAGRAGRVGLAGFLGTLFFLPTWPAGPIERTDTFSRQLEGPPGGWAEVVGGLHRIVLGLGRKLLLADPLLVWGDAVLRTGDPADTGRLGLAVYAYALGLYLDFGAYSDLAIGAGALAGLRVRENFDWPYLRPDLASLWQHWHMSLTGWLRDYVFVPSARRALRATGSPLASHAIANTLTMVACGLWHGLAWHYAVWGLYHAAGLTALAAWRARRGPRRAPRTRVATALGTLATFHFFALGLVLFACDLPRAGRVLAALAGAAG